MMRAAARSWVFIVMLVIVPACASAQERPELRFSVTEGQIRNEFYRDGPVAAHVVLRSGNAPRLLVAFPAGNSGVGLWFDEKQPSFAWRDGTRVTSRVTRLSGGGLRRGIVTDITASTPTLTVRRSLIGNVRVLRDYGYGNTIPASVEAVPRLTERSATWERRRIDGAPGYLLSVELLNGTISGGGHTPIRFTSDKGDPLRFRLTAQTGDPPLTPIPAEEIFADNAAPDPQLRNALTFLSYDEKLLAGSWRFNTYFGRDTLMSVRLLMPVLEPRPVEAGLDAVFARLNVEGQVAHEEDLAEYALLHRQRDGQPLTDEAILDYKMVDDDFMLAPVVAHYLLDTEAGRARARDFLSRRLPSGHRIGDLLVRNLAFVMDQTRPFADAPDYRHLITLRPGLTVGEWRDSANGLGGDGRYPYNINAALVPAALRAAQRLGASGLLRGHGDPDILVDAGRMADIWQREAPRLFVVEQSGADARRLVERYAAAVGITPVDPGDAPTRYHAIALDAAGQPIEIMHSDEGFALLLSDPDPASLDVALSAIMLRFPAGLMTDAGMLVANPAFANPSRFALFDRTRYHGTVVWSWQQGLLASGLARQRARTDLPPASIALVAEAQTALKQAMAGAPALRSSELWSWSFADGRYTPVPFGQNLGDETESNAAQLWSTISLASQRTR